MFLKKSQFKASTLCASSALLVLGGFMTINLAGCGGGGGGGNGGGFGSPTATPASQNITFRLVRQSRSGPENDLSASKGGSLTLTSTTSPGTVLSATANANGIATLANVPPGVYDVRFTVVGDTGANLSTTTTRLTITRASGQTFLLIQDQGTGSTGGFSVSGTVRLNPRATATPVPTTSGTPTATGTPTGTATATPAPSATPNPFRFSNCTPTSDFVTSPYLVEAIDLDTAKGRPVIAQVRRSATTLSDPNRGTYTIFLPYRPAAFQIRISKLDTDLSGDLPAGLSALSNFNGATAVTGLNICINKNGVVPEIPATVVFTPTPTFPFFRTPTPAPTITATQ